MEIVRDDKEVKKEPLVGKAETRIEYDPSKQYKWKPTDVFYIPGNDFGILLHSLRSVLSTPEARVIMLAERANDIMETTLARAVEAGIAVESKEEVKK
jgi:hypothetical protein